MERFCYRTTAAAVADTIDVSKASSSPRPSSSVKFPAEHRERHTASPTTVETRRRHASDDDELLLDAGFSGETAGRTGIDDDIDEETRQVAHDSLVDLARRRPLPTCRRCLEPLDVERVDVKNVASSKTAPTLVYKHECVPETPEVVSINAKPSEQYAIQADPLLVPRAIEIPIECREYDRPKLRRIKSRSDVRPGDEITWHRGICACLRPERGSPGIWHHAIVENVDDDDDRSNGIDVIGYTPVAGSRFRVEVQRKRETFDLAEQDVYVVDYVECYSNDYALGRARQAVVAAGVAAAVADAPTTDHQRRPGYNCLTHNCEHFARWAKTGVPESNQTVKLCGMFCVSVTMLMFRLAALVALLFLEWAIPDDDDNLRSAEVESSALFATLWLSLVASMFLYARCRRRKGSLLEHGVGRRCVARCRARRCCERNAGLFVGKVVEVFVAWFIPMIVVTVVQWHYDGRHGFTYVCITVVLVVGFIVLYPVGLLVGRGVESMFGLCSRCCRCSARSSRRRGDAAWI